ncbi:Lipoprotein signal peptidase [Anaplasma phagocytophilum]|nr:Lipoprotein signal peptidase [Anaplasma phagocytophilum]
MGGALGNFMDRLRFGAVYDFIDLHIGDWHWPAFNLADLTITCGVIVFLAMELRKRRQLNA